MSLQPETWMWAEACQMLERVERLQRQFFQLGPPDAGQPAWEPPVDIYDTGDGYWIFVALPGVPTSEVAVAIEDGRLVVNGSRPVPPACRSAGLVRLEIPHGRLRRSVALPTGQFEIVGRDLVDGCLELRLRRQ